LAPLFDETCLPHLRYLHVECAKSLFPPRHRLHNSKSEWKEALQNRNVKVRFKSPPGRSMTEILAEHNLIPEEEWNSHAWSPPIGPVVRSYSPSGERHRRDR
jgi:hypothetical protein